MILMLHPSQNQSGKEQNIDLLSNRDTKAITPSSNKNIFFRQITR